MPVEADLSPKAAEKVAREAAVQSFDNAARSIGIDWCIRLDGDPARRPAEAKGAGGVLEDAAVGRGDGGVGVGGWRTG